MEATTIQLQSIWGAWWVPIRKWFYPAWLVYETAIRCYDYGLWVYHYFDPQAHSIIPYIGETASQVLAIVSGVVTFMICAVFLIVPASMTLFHFFNKANVTNTPLEHRLKKYF